MATFRSPATQAASVMKSVQGTEIRSVGTVRNYEQGLTRVAEWAQQQRIDGGLRGMTPELAVRYLEERGQAVGQKTLDMERQAMQCMMRHVTQQLPPGELLPVIKSEHQQALEGRAYTAVQVDRIVDAQTPKNALATEIAYAAGLRAHELLTLQPAGERTADPRPALDTKFTGREGVIYTVEGKGGLVREVQLPRDLAERLEAQRLLESKPFDAVVSDLRLKDGSGLELLAWTPELRQWQARIALLRRLDLQQKGESEWPDLSDAALRDSLEGWLLPFLGKVSRLSHFASLDLPAMLSTLLPWPLPQRLDELAPKALSVPSGSRIAIDYSEQPPVLAVRLQELFGLAETPRIAGGRQSVLLHLLSPARRPVQVTQDLASFWANTYAEVKKDLKGRYPKHYWPDDPLIAEPTARAKPRK